MLAIAFVLGISSGLRTFTAPAVVLLALHDRVAGLIVAVLALGEYYLDLQPNTPSRTGAVGLSARMVSGAFVGWMTARAPGACAAIVGALIGTYGGHALRLRAIKQIGAIPAGLTEDVIAVAIAVLAAIRLT